MTTNSEASSPPPQAENAQELREWCATIWDGFLEEVGLEDAKPEQRQQRIEQLAQIIEAHHATALASALPPPPFHEMGKGWRVEVSRFGEQIVSLEERLLTGKPDISDADAETIRGCAEHLLSFIGQPRALPPPPTETPVYQPCRLCERGIPLAVVDQDGTFSHISKRPGTVCHTWDDKWAPCLAAPAALPPPREGSEQTDEPR